MATPADVRVTLKGLQDHPHDHGWHSFYAVLERLLDEESEGGGGPLTRVAQDLATRRYARVLRSFA